MNLYVNIKVMSSKFFGNRTEKKESKTDKCKDSLIPKKGCT